MKTTFQYRKEATDDGSIIFRPIAKVLLKGKNNKMVIDYMYIDSGADFTLIPYKLGIYLGLQQNQTAVNDIQGINGTVGVIYDKIEISIGQVPIKAKIAWAQIENVPLLLGRTDIFDEFKITFDQKRKNIVFIPRKSRN